MVIGHHFLMLRFHFHSLKKGKKWTTIQSRSSWVRARARKSLCALGPGSRRNLSKNLTRMDNEWGNSDCWWVIITPLGNNNIHTMSCERADRVTRSKQHHDLLKAWLETMSFFRSLCSGESSDPSDMIPEKLTSEHFDVHKVSFLRLKGPWMLCCFYASSCLRRSATAFRTSRPAWPTTASRSSWRSVRTKES